MEKGCSNKIEREGSQGEGEIWVNDSSVDHMGRVPLRASTGAWKAALFIIVIEFSERLSYFGLATNLIIYLTRVLHQEVKTAAKNVNYWQGVTTLMPLFGGFIADAYLGRFSTVLCSSVIYILGLVLLTLSQLAPSLKPCDAAETCHRSLHIHSTIFFTAMYLISIGTGGHKPSLESFGADQFDDDHAGERKAKMSYFNWWNCALCSGLMLGVTLIVYMQDKVSWGAAAIVLTAVMVFALAVFLAGRPYYRYREPEGSPLVPMLQVLAAAVTKRGLALPEDAAEIFLDKAAIMEHKEDTTAAAEKPNPWRLATVTEVEETKQVLAMIPIWLSSLPLGICIAQGSTFFIKQASIMDRKLVRSFELPPAFVYSFSAIGMILCVSFYDKILVPFLRKTTGNERGINMLQRIGIGMLFSVVAMATAAVVEQKRLDAGVADAMSVFWLLPQFMILGFGDGFALVGLQEYFYDQVPDSMRSLGIAFYLSVLGAASFLSSLLIIIVDHVTSWGGKSRSWFAKSLNESRLDLFYWLLAVINAVNLCGYVYLASRYSYKSVKRRVMGISNSSEEDEDMEDNVS
ncbi:Protein NRT1/ PTR FAMILY 5.7 [Ananas comosus]|uniref:Protein NRT1/ PTR FAMILY 5.7 n=1 Tax=Ananas comosus TaxID=4615 RepID=A0A199VMM1_ANACO|nr:Protein NRT1/ PTR FAMILY 5.7 [Ananas comosus]